MVPVKKGKMFEKTFFGGWKQHLYDVDMCR